MKIVNKSKFVRMMFTCVGIILFLIMFVSNISFSKGKIKEKSICITEGDTLWSIAMEQQETNYYYADKDIRDIVFEIKELNNLDADSILRVGQKLIVKSI